MSIAVLSANRHTFDIRMGLMAARCRITYADGISMSAEQIPMASP